MDFDSRTKSYQLLPVIGFDDDVVYVGDDRLRLTDG